MKFAFMILLNEEAEVETASIQQGATQIVAVSSMEQACLTAQKLCAEGVDCIELCGAFGAEGAQKIIEATGNKIPIGYVVHLKEQDHLFQQLFG